MRLIRIASIHGPNTECPEQYVVCHNVASLLTLVVHCLIARESAPDEQRDNGWDPEYEPEYWRLFRNCITCLRHADPHIDRRSDEPNGNKRQRSIGDG